MSMDEHFSVSSKSATSKVLVTEGESDNYHHHHHHDNHHRPSSSYDVGHGNGRGPTCNSRPRTSSSIDIYNVIGGFPGAAVAFDSSGSGELRPLQPFDIGVPADTLTRTTQNTFKSPGAMAASKGFPFTNAQWKELERQAMIYKYMMASVPVPPDLLFPIIRSPPLSAAASFGGDLNLLRFSSGGDLEPGRCKRTDGKKWRCSRDVAPDQKYCERHLHRGRPRSRKPVELPPPNNKKKTRLEPHHHSHPPPLPAPIPNSIDSTTNVFTSPSHYLGTLPQTFFSPIESVKEQRCLDWTMKGEPIQMSSSSSQGWHHVMQQTGMGLAAESSFSNACCNLRYGEHYLNLNSYSNFTGSEDQHGATFPFFIDPDLVALEKQHQAESPRGFIDAWSNGVSDDDNNAHAGNKSCSVSSNGTLPLSPLSLSMGGNSHFGEEMGQVQRGLRVSDSGQDNDCSTKATLSSWLNPVAWPTSTLGGPLAEVLRPSTVAAASDPPSPPAESGDPGSPSTTRLSSPSGVLQKTLASLSDSSGNSSPTLANSRANKPEVSLLWLTQEKL